MVELVGGRVVKLLVLVVSCTLFSKVVMDSCITGLVPVSID